MIREHRFVLGGTLVSGSMLTLFLVLQEFRPTLLRLPPQWLWISLAPVMLSLVAGGYIGRLKAGSGGIELVVPDRRLKKLPEAKRGKSQEQRTDLQWQRERVAEYERTSGLALVHLYTASQEPGQIFDAFIYVVRHEKNTFSPPRTGLDDVQKVEFYFGESWGHQVFPVENSGDNILGVRAHAFGAFLATCRVTWADGKRNPIVLHRYIDCEMLPTGPGRRDQS